MKSSKLILVLSAALSLPVFAEDATKLSTEKEKASYALGAGLGSQIKRDAQYIDLEQFIQGLKAVYNNEPLAMTPQEINEAVNGLRAKKEQQLAASGEQNKTAGAKFLEDNSKVEGVKTTASGLQYRVLQAGTGKQPTASDTVVTHYRGTLINGTEFDSSYKRNQPATFRVDGVIKGWTEALQMMKTGAKWQLFIPSDLAYGGRAVGRHIEPNSTLIFEIELLEVK